MPNIHLVHGDAMNLPFEDNTFDFSHVKVRSFTGGVAAMHLGYK